ncbi:MAG TPA: efflux RND transporter periplasmic adaptor subunit [Gemmatimonadaceae bacterium]|nr:efflux RND transporter periplasmic adaptor subunit [Gemmatimonadaceae bacterium]
MKRLILPAAALLLAACSGKDKNAAPLIQTAPVTRQDIVVDVEATGIIAPVNAVEVRSKASGQIIKLPVELGSRVKPGDLLAQIDPRDAQNRYDQAVAAREAAEANLEVTKAQFDRSTQLAQEGVITAPELESAKLSYANAKSQLATARTNLDIAKVALEDVTIRAPVAGVVIQKLVSVGQVISSSTNSPSGGTILLQMADLSHVRDSTLVGESDIGRVRPGLTASVRVDAYPNRVFHGTVDKIAPQATVEQSVTMFPVLINIDNQDGALMPGMNSDVSVLVSRADGALAIPNDAIRTTRDVETAALALGMDPDKAKAALDAQTPQGRPTDSANPGRSGEMASAGRRNGARGGARNGFRQGGNGGNGGSRQGMRGTPGGEGGNGGPQLQMGGGEDVTTPESRPRPGLVFVADSVGFAPRLVTLGVGNYDVTQVLSGLREGERVALISGAMLQQARTERQERIRSRVGLPGVRQESSSRSSNRR